MCPKSVATDRAAVVTSVKVLWLAGNGQIETIFDELCADLGVNVTTYRVTAPIAATNVARTIVVQVFDFIFSYPLLYPKGFFFTR
jgi:hypothetical protein